MMNDIMKWNLDDVLSKKQFDTLCAEIERDIRAIKGYLEKMHPGMEQKEFAEFSRFDEETSKRLNRLLSFPAMILDCDQKDPQARVLKKKAEDLLERYQNASRPIWHWIKGKDVAGKQHLDD